VVTVTADDWSDWVVTDRQTSFPVLINLFRSYGLYVTIGVQTGSNDTHAQTWNALQQQVDAGYVEVASHSRTHPPTPYSDAVGEVIGSALDIIAKLTLPPPFSMNGKEYVYTWSAPYGNYDSTVDSLVGVAGYLDARLYANLDTTSPREYIYGDSTLSAWDETRSHFRAFFPTVELGAPSWGGGDTSLTSLNDLFDTIVRKGDVYHMMWHPQVIFADRNKPYLTNHLSYISGRKDIWYTNLGLLYLYHLIQQANSSEVTSVTLTDNIPNLFKLYQNYPNPFNPTTTICYYIPKPGQVRLEVFNILGQQVDILVDGYSQAGDHIKIWNFSQRASGIYFYRILFEGVSQTKSMVLVK
jgi:Secretion system C-terminal sorting domain/Polysaccharide deacetylase